MYRLPPCKKHLPNFCKANRNGVLLLLAMLLFSCQQQARLSVTEGVSLELATYRAGTISDLHYMVNFAIPDSLSAGISGRVEAEFQLSELSQPVVIDFFAAPENLHSVKVDAGDIPYTFRNGHIIIESQHVQLGKNRIIIEFTAGEGPLNRTKDYLYTLFVPDRAAEAFPCFDQPNLKACYQLSLDIPAHWHAVTNGPVQKETSDSAHKNIVFEQTAALPTYLFSFAAGEFDKIVAVRDGRTLEMYHRETDRSKIEKNQKAIFDLHAQAISWLETYTGIPYPFSKFGFVLISSFQYGGMEHPGAILYRASRLLLDASATQSDVLGRASLIAHETAHIWFGDLVTMNWFDDVWMKEVFANFMAAKIANPAFPELNHELRFLFAHYPAAYEVDRTAGANPIRQQLENLKEAGSLYGAIIYQKAPIVMRQLERLVGETAFQQGIQTYLSQFAFGNANWPQLIEILDELSDENLQKWSRVWVGEAGMPTIETATENGNDGQPVKLMVRQSDPTGKGRMWAQNLTAVVSTDDKLYRFPVALRESQNSIELPTDTGEINFVLGNGDGAGYGYFALDADSREYLLQHAHTLGEPVLRGVALLTLWEEFLNEKIMPAQLLATLQSVILVESNTQIVQRALEMLHTIYWQFFTDDIRREIAPALEDVLWQKMADSPQANVKASFFRAFRDMALTPDGVQKLLQIWQKTITVSGLPFSENDFTTIAMELAVRDVAGSADIVQQQIERIDNQDRADRLRFVAPALYADAAVRDAFFLSLQDVRNRHREAWVLTALHYLHHPLRAEMARDYLRLSLDLLEEIQRTGDIFFPKRWLDATLSGHQSAEAAEVVAQFLQENPNYPRRLRGKILQSADMLFRSAKVLHNWQQ